MRNILCNSGPFGLHGLSRRTSLIRIWLGQPLLPSSWAIIGPGFYWNYTGAFFNSGDTKEVGWPKRTNTWTVFVCAWVDCPFFDLFACKLCRGFSLFCRRFYCEEKCGIYCGRRIAFCCHFLFVAASKSKRRNQFSKNPNYFFTG